MCDVLAKSHFAGEDDCDFPWLWSLNLHWKVKYSLNKSSIHIYRHRTAARGGPLFSSRPLGSWETASFVPVQKQHLTSRDGRGGFWWVFIDQHIDGYASSGCLSMETPAVQISTIMPQHCQCLCTCVNLSFSMCNAYSCVYREVKIDVKISNWAGRSW